MRICSDQILVIGRRRLICGVGALDEKGRVNDKGVKDGHVEEKRVDAVGGILPLEFLLLIYERLGVELLHRFDGLVQLNDVAQHGPFGDRERLGKEGEGLVL